MLLADRGFKMPESRTKNSIRNIVVSIGMQLTLLILSFITRTVFIKLLGENYLGITDLYSNILSILSLSDLGINTVDYQWPDFVYS